MKFEDVRILTAKALSQFTDSTYLEQSGSLEGMPIEKLIDVGKDVLDLEDGATVEKFTKALISVISRYEFVGYNVPHEFDLWISSSEWGGFVERIYANSLQQYLEDPSYTLANGQNLAPIEHGVYIPTVSAKIFNEAKAGMVPLTLQRTCLYEAFRGPDELTSYISALESIVNNTIEMIKESYARLAVSSAIAISDKATNTAVHLLTEAKAAGIVDTDTTAEQALENPDFLSFACRRITEVQDYMKVPSTAFNNQTIISSAMQVDTYVLKDFLRAVKYNLKADTYHSEDRSIEAKGVTCWQGISDGSGKFDWASLSKIMLAADAENKLGVGTSAVTINNVVGVAFDHRAVGCSLAKFKTTSSYTASSDMWNYFNHVLVNFLVDTNLNITAFILD